MWAGGSCGLASRRVRPLGLPRRVRCRRRRPRQRAGLTQADQNARATPKCRTRLRWPLRRWRRFRRPRRGGGLGPSLGFAVARVRWSRCGIARGARACPDGLPLGRWPRRPVDRAGLPWQAEERCARWSRGRQRSRSERVGVPQPAGFVFVVVVVVVAHRAGGVASCLRWRSVHQGRSCSAAGGRLS